MPIGDYDSDDESHRSILTQIAFNRIILDEGHVIRNPKSNVSQAVCRLRASRRWIVTGVSNPNWEKSTNYSIIFPVLGLVVLIL